MGARRRLTDDEVRALFEGRTEANANPIPNARKSRAFVARYDRCHECGQMMPCLLTFTGDLDAYGDEASTRNLKAQLRRLQASSGRRTILLCCPCIDDLRAMPADDVSDDVPQRLF